jgi:predicted transcriptional regulator of viral defense system
MSYHYASGKVLKGSDVESWYKTVGILDKLPTVLYHCSMETARNRAIEIIRKNGGLIGTHEALAKGIHRRTLYGLRDEGTLVPISRGLFQLADLDIPAQVDLVEISKKVPKGVICLISALVFHELTTQIPHQVWLAIDRKARKPKIDYPPARVFFFSNKSFTSGIETHQIMEHKVRIYNPPKTIIDCFRWRKTVGLDVAIEAAKEYLKWEESSPAILMEYAKASKVEKIIRPYLEAMTI